MIKYRPQTDAFMRRQQNVRREEAARGYRRDQSDEAVVTVMTATATLAGLHAELHRDVGDEQKQRWRRERRAGGAPERLLEHQWLQLRGNQPCLPTSPPAAGVCSRLCSLSLPGSQLASVAISAFSFLALW